MIFPFVQDEVLDLVFEVVAVRSVVADLFVEASIFFVVLPFP